MENIIYNELLYREYTVDVGVVEITESKDGKRVKKQCEIGFVVNKGAKKYYPVCIIGKRPRKDGSRTSPTQKTDDFFKPVHHCRKGVKAAERRELKMIACILEIYIGFLKGESNE